MLSRTLLAKKIKETAFKNGKMAFVTGPRQVGKTTLSLEIGKSYPKSQYYIWDDTPFKRQWATDPKSIIEMNQGPKPLIILDELHKAPSWKTRLKGLYDLRKQYADILVTGSARLNVFRKGGDSLLGRYYLFHLHPFSVGELIHTEATPQSIVEGLNNEIKPQTKILETLFQFGGFPEPYTKKNTTTLNLWQRSRIERLVREDLLDISRTQEISSIESMASFIPEKIGSPFSVQSLSEDLSIPYPTIKRWLSWLEQLFYLYSLPPYTYKLARSLKKQPKIYLWDWSEIEDKGNRFENLVAGHLLKTVNFWTDTGLGNFSLYYLRDKERHETDFLITEKRKPWMLVECKYADTQLDPSLKYFSEKLDIPHAIQVVYKSGHHKMFHYGNKKLGHIISADKLLTLLS
ncbi:MAG: ATP-binding protein [Deltaproteobacteria bacterium]|nr:MAG: ATP-binding protein [Deltaproteobacteria bacterium]